MSYIPRSIGASDMYARMTDSTGQYVRIMYNVADIGSKKMVVLLDTINSDIKQVFEDETPYVHVAGASVITTYGIRYLVHTNIKSFTCNCAYCFGNCMVVPKI